MLHLPALRYFDASVTYPQWFRSVKFVVIPPRFVEQQCLWNIAIQPAVGCYNSWAYLQWSSCLPLKEKSLWNGTIGCVKEPQAMMTSSNGNIFRVTGPLCGEFTGPGPVNSPYKGQWRGALMFSLIYAWINDWVNNREAGDLGRQRVHYDVIVMHTVQCHGRDRRCMEGKHHYNWLLYKVVACIICDGWIWQMVAAMSETLYLLLIIKYGRIIWITFKCLSCFHCQNDRFSPSPAILR